MIRTIQFVFVLTNIIYFWGAEIFQLLTLSNHLRFFSSTVTREMDHVKGTAHVAETVCVWERLLVLALNCLSWDSGKNEAGVVLVQVWRAGVMTGEVRSCWLTSATAINLRWRNFGLLLRRKLTFVPCPVRIGGVIPGWGQVQRIKERFSYR